MLEFLNDLTRGEIIDNASMLQKTAAQRMSKSVRQTRHAIFSSKLPQSFLPAAWNASDITFDVAAFQIVSHQIVSQ